MQPTAATRERDWLAPCARGLEPLLADELRALGAERVEENSAAVGFTGNRAVMYRACLWSRLASRVLLPLAEGPAQDADALYALIAGIPWAQHLAASASLAVDFHGSNAAIRDTRFGAQRSKDAIVDALRAAGRERPRIAPADADLRISVRLRDDRADVALDLVGESLHRRGYRQGAGAAPLKETLACALLLRAGWPQMLARGGALIDPLCGSGTLLIEGAFMAADRAPALERGRFGFHGWEDHDEAQWQTLRSDARGRFERALEAGLPEIRGYDGDPRVIRKAEENIRAAGLSRHVRVTVRALREVKRPTHKPLPEGLVICNPPYGERLGDRDSLAPLYRGIGELLHDQFQGWEAAILTADKALGKALGLRSHRQYALHNGRIPVHLLLLTLRDNRLADAPQALAAGAQSGAPDLPAVEEQPAAAAQTAAQARPHAGAVAGEAGSPARAAPRSAGAPMFANRLRKNQRRLDKWLRREGISCYRLYDADMPEYAVAVDRYEDWLHVAEYKPPQTVDAAAAAQRIEDVLQVLPEATGVPRERIALKVREVQRGRAQYGRQDGRSELLSVHEGQARFLVNLHDYLDTGLFLDHRPLRRQIASEAKDKRFLNLFCYTGSATVQAALAGAKHCTSVDLSNTYLRWLRRNLAHNGLPESRHRFERADCQQWLQRAGDRFDLILLDPPSFSNSTSMDGSFDVQRDHPSLIQATMARLEAGGTLYFSTNRRRFQLAPEVSEHFAVKDVTEATLDPDYPRRPPAHRCWRLRHRGGE